MVEISRKPLSEKQRRELRGYVALSTRPARLLIYAALVALTGLRSLLPG